MNFISSTRTDDWERALVTGNGRVGALVYGGPGVLRVTFSHERLFLPVDPPQAPPRTAHLLPELRGLLYDGRYQDAADRFMAAAGAEGYDELRWIDPFIGAATLTLTLDGEPSGPFRRGTDFATGRCWQAWPGARQEVGITDADEIIIRFTGLTGALALHPVGGDPAVPIEFGTEGSAERIVLKAAWADGGYTVTCDLSHDEDTLTVRARIVLPTPDRPRERDHAGLFGRCTLTLAERDGVPVAEDLLERGGPALEQAVFDAARYAIIAATGDLPPTLQGVWSGTLNPAWQSGFTIDGNLQAAVAGLLPTGTPELMLPVFDLFDRLVPDFRENARNLYGCRGILTPGHISTHGLNNHLSPRWCLMFWTAGAAWLSRLYYDYFSYTRDREFLMERALPFMREAAAFYEDFLDEKDNFVPSYSPENSALDSQAAINATMDLAAVRDLVRNLRRVDPRDRWTRLGTRLPRYRLARTGELAEWAWPLPENHAHRHASHLYPFWYEGDDAAGGGPEAVRARLAWWRGAESDEMAFGLGQLGLAAAHLGMTAEAHEVLTLLTGRYWRANMVSTHNRDHLFNVDICGSVPALMAAMLVRSTESTLDLLPACPWKAGSATGLRGRGGVLIDRLTWGPDGFEADLRSVRPTTVLVGGQPVGLNPDRPRRIASRVTP